MSSSLGVLSSWFDRRQFIRRTQTSAGNSGPDQVFDLDDEIQSHDNQSDDEKMFLIMIMMMMIINDNGGDDDCRESDVSPRVQTRVWSSGEGVEAEL